MSWACTGSCSFYCFSTFTLQKLSFLYCPFKTPSGYNFLQFQKNKQTKQPSKFLSALSSWIIMCSVPFVNQAIMARSDFQFFDQQTLYYSIPTILTAIGVKKSPHATCKYVSTHHFKLLLPLEERECLPLSKWQWEAHMTIPFP